MSQLKNNLIRVNKMKNKLSQLRKKAKITQADLSDILHVSRQTVSSIENGHYSPALGLAFRISKFFKKPIEEIFIYEE
jgi:Predicted transcriptional regulators